MGKISSNFYSEEELKQLGLKNFGVNVLISRKCSIYGAGNIDIGNNVRIDDFCILSGKINIGNYVHISAYTVLYGKYGIEINNYCGISANSILYSAVDDFSGEFMISPMVPEKFTNVTGGKIILENYSQIGANSIVMPNVVVSEGAVCGAFSFVNKKLDAWTINVGIPTKVLKKRSKQLLRFNDEFDGI